MNRNLVFFSLLSLVLVVSIPQAIADPSADLRVIVIDPEAGGFDSALTFGTVPSNGDVYSLHDPENIAGVEDIVAFDGDVYVADATRISRINLDGSGQPDGGLGNNIDVITGDIFSDLLGITVDSSGILYVSDSDNQIYTVNPSGAPTAGKSLVSITQTFVDIRDIAINGNFLYILDAGAEDGAGAIYKVDLSDFTIEPVYSDVDEPLTDTFGIAVKGNEIFVSGSFSFGPGILQITSSGAVEFSDNTNGELSFPLDLTIDEAGNDLYVTEGVFIYRFSLDSTPSQPILEIQSDSFFAPVGLTTLTITGQVADLDLTLTKTVNATSALPGQGLLYTITATNEGPDPATAVLIHDFFPINGVESVETSSQLSFTSEVHDVSESTVIQAGNCERRNNDAYVVDCDEFGTLDAGDFVVVTLEGKIIEGAGDTLTNLAVVENFGENAEATATTTLDLPISLSSVKTASPDSVVAGDGSIDYVIRIENSNTVDALDVIITDTLPNGVSALDVTLEPSSTSCQVTSGIDETTILQCGPYNIQNTNGFVEIHYTVNVDSDATDPLQNNVEVTCTNCALIETVPTSTEIIRQSDLSIDKTSNTDSVTAGQDSILYTISVTNDGISDASNVIITDNLPAGVTFTTAGSSPECSDVLQNNVVTCNISSLTVGETLSFDINVNVNSDAVGQLENTASVTSDSDDTNLGNNEASSDPIDVIQLADVTVTKTGPSTTVAGRIITYEFTVTNIGSSNADNVVVSDELPIGLTFIPSIDLTCQDQLGTIECQFGTVGAGQSITKSVQVQIGLTVTGNIQNTATIETSTEESDSDNNLSTITTFVEPPFCGRAESDFDNVITGTSGNDHIKGTNDDDLIFGLGGNDKIHGKNGNDCIIGGDGDDKIWGGKGDDGIEGNAGNDRIHGQQGNDTLTGGDGDDRIYGGQGNDTIDAGSGNDKVHANQGDDTVTGGDGNDWLGAGIGNDVVSGGTGNDKIFGRPGNDILNGDDGDDYVHGGQGNDTVDGGNGNDKIFGQQGHDILNGNDNDDYIHGGQGNDNIDGGNGYDRCNGAQGTNTIINCEVEDKKMKEEHEENDDDEGESEDDAEDDDDNHDDDHDEKKDKKEKDK